MRHPRLKKQYKKHGARRSCFPSRLHLSRANGQNSGFSNFANGASEHRRDLFDLQHEGIELVGE